MFQSRSISSNAAHMYVEEHNKIKAMGIKFVILKQWWKINISDIFKNIWNFKNQILTLFTLNSIVLLALGPNKVLYFSDVVHKKIYSSHLDGDWKAQGQEVINVGRSRSQKNFQQKTEPQSCIWIGESNEIEYCRFLLFLMYST